MKEYYLDSIPYWRKVKVKIHHVNLYHVEEVSCWKKNTLKVLFRHVMENHVEGVMLRVLCWGCYVEGVMLRVLCWGCYVEGVMLRVLCWGFYAEGVMLRVLCWGCYVEGVMLRVLCWGCYAEGVKLRVLCWICTMLKIGNVEHVILKACHVETYAETVILNM